MNYKMKVTPEESRRVQECAFKHGYKWNGGDTRVSCTDSTFLYFGEKKIITQSSGNETYFFTHKNIRISPQAFIDLLEKNSFQVGDTLVYARLDDGYTCLQIGDHVEVENLRDDGMIKVLTISTKPITQIVTASCFDRHVEQTLPFKVGDRVRTHGNYTFDLAEGVIVDREDEKYIVHIERSFTGCPSSDFSYRNWTYSASHLTKIEPPKYSAPCDVKGWKTVSWDGGLNIAVSTTGTTFIPKICVTPKEDPRYSWVDFYSKTQNSCPTSKEYQQLHSPFGKKGAFMSCLKKLTNFMKTSLDKAIQPMYQLGYVEVENDDLTVTDDGYEAVVDFLVLEYPAFREAFGKFCADKVAEKKKAEKKLE